MVSSVLTMLEQTSFRFIYMFAVVTMSFIMCIDSDKEETISTKGFHQGRFSCPQGFTFILNHCERCPPFLLPEHCISECDCGGKGYCNLYPGGCACNEGWKGRNCGEPCSPGSYGFRCRDRCKCKNNAFCDHISGRCNCTAGYQGPFCEEKCPNGTHGYNCTNECKCQNDAACHHEDGSCECAAGWIGEVCAEKCPEGTYGINCSMICNCYNNATCDAITGECICSEGFYGDNCEVDCSMGKRQMDNSQEYNYSDTGNAKFDGRNSCLPGFSGKNCQERDCPANMWGYTCSNNCNCKNGGYCHPATGICWCENGWIGEDCSVSLNEYFQKQFMENKGVNSSVIVPAFIIPLVLLLLILAGFIYYKKRPSIKNRSEDDDKTLPAFIHMSNEGGN